MKKLDNTINAFIGIFFIIAPWVFVDSDNSIILWISVIGGAIMLLSSLLSFKESAWNFVSALAGVWFIAFPFIYTMDSAEKWTNVVLGAIVVFFNLRND
ncbi:SPW repeat protein [Paenibacillus frigoriresistens]|uniref:SPW repeat domain-containing protein n=1 Tax=Paenibacillus alginolyticus TaxID=59839 RepID=UPI00156702F4|nr:SPW repeat protein [Paenibacillus frigoriresistens]NRF95899.1 SPW repeat protein [Paenibacillus frigoriresistens]